MSYDMTTQKRVRAFFWGSIFAGSGAYRISRKRMRDGDYNTDTRCAFVDFVDMLQKSGAISEALASRATL